MSQKKKDKESQNIYSALKAENCEFLGVQMFEKGSASSGSRRQSIIQTLSKQEMSARDKKKKIQDEFKSMSPKKPTISKFFFHKKAQAPMYIEEYQTPKSHRKLKSYNQNQLNQGNERSQFNSPLRENNSSSKLFAQNLEIPIFNSAPRHPVNLDDDKDGKPPGVVNESLIKNINQVASKEIEQHYKDLRSQNEQQAKKAVQKTNKGIKISLQKIIQQREQEQSSPKNQRVELSDNYYLNSVINRNENADEPDNGEQDKSKVIQKKPSMATLLKEPGAQKPWSRKSLDELKKNIINQIKDLKKNNQDRFELLKEKQQGD